MSGILSFLIGVACLGTVQASQLTVESVVGHPGSEAEINVSFSAQGGEATAVQFDVQFDGNLLSVTAAAGDAATAAVKDVGSNQIDPDTLRVVVAGFNQNVIGDGALVVLTVAISPQAPIADYAFALDDVSATDQGGGAIDVTAVDGILAVREEDGADAVPHLIFPQYADGIISGMVNQTRVILRNNSSEQDTGSVRFLDSSGNPQAVMIDGTPVSLAPYDLDPWSSAEITTDGMSASLLSGPLTVHSDRGVESGVEATVIFTILGNFVSVDSAPLRSEHQIYVSSNSLEKTGLAVYNPGDVDVTLDLSLLDAAGAEATLLAVVLPAGEQFSLFLDQQPLFDEFFAQNPTFKGTLNIRVAEGGTVALISLIQRLDNGALISVAASANPAP